MRRSIVAGNWKMHKTVPEGLALASELANRSNELTGECEVVLCPPFTALAAIAERVSGSGIEVGAQNVHWEAKGAFTGEVSCTMLVDAGCRWVVIGHSERRAMFGETDATVNQKVKAAMAAGLLPIVCVGETLEQRELGITDDVVRRQVEGAVVGLPAVAAAKLVVAYEPVWAIGAGRASNGEDANAVASGIRSALLRLYSSEVAQAVRIQYGGSVKASNMAEFARQPEIDGALVGGASLEASDFARIIQATIESKRLR